MIVEVLTIVLLSFEMLQDAVDGLLQNLRQTLNLVCLEQAL